MGCPGCEIEKDNFRNSQGKEIRTENKESFESKVLKQRQHCVCSCHCRRGFVYSLMAPFGHPDNKWLELFTHAQDFIGSLGISDKVPGLIVCKRNITLNF